MTSHHFLFCTPDTSREKNFFQPKGNTFQEAKLKYDEVIKAMKAKSGKR